MDWDELQAGDRSCISFWVRRYSNNIGGILRVVTSLLVAYLSVHWARKCTACLPPTTQVR